MAQTSRARWFRRRPVLLFVIVTFLVSYGLGIPALFIVGAGAPGIHQVTALYAGRFFVVIGPTCGAIAVISATSGRRAIPSFLRGQLCLPKASWAFVILFPLLAMTLVLAAYACAGSPLGTLAAALRAAWPLLLIHIALQFLTVGLGEELGWRGWLLPTLTGRHGLPRATFATGIVWYFWHIPILLGGVHDAFWFGVAITGLSMILSVIWLLSGRSAVLPALAHGSLNAVVVFLTATLPEADHKLAWTIISGMLAVSGLGAFVWARAAWREGSKA